MKTDRKCWRRGAIALGAGAALLALTGLGPSAGATGPFTRWDQRNDGVINANSWNTASSYAPFTPTLAAVDTVQLCVAGDLSQVRVHIREGSDEGPILGTSDTQTTLPGDNIFTIVYSPLTFTFASPVPLVPGSTYVIDTEQVAGLSFAAHAPLDPTNPFGSSGGLWFREGLSASTPDASSLAAPTCP